MTWEIYAIIIVLIFWVSHKLVLMGLERINELKQIFSEQGVPLVIDGGWTKGDVIKVSYSNASDETIVGFLIEIGVKENNNNSSEIELVGQFIDISTKPIKPYRTKIIQLQITGLDINTKFISEIAFKKVVFEDNKTWERK